MMIVDNTVTDFIKLLADGTPTPGGGSAAALGGTMAAALAEMVCNLTLNNKKYCEVQKEIEVIKNICQSHRHRLLKLVDEDANAFDEVMAAFKLPKDERRPIAIQSGYMKAASVPMQTAEHCLGILQQAATVARIGNKNSITDAGTAAQMAYAALHSALLNVQINLSAIRDEDFVNKLKDNIERIETEAKILLNITRSLVNEAL